MAHHNRQQQQHQHPHWSYAGEYGPSSWWRLAPAAQGWHQSPVNIVTSEAIFDQALSTRLLRPRYVPASCHRLVNTGHGVQADIHYDDNGFLKSCLEGGPYRHRYRLQQFHFHWGQTNDSGSEHLINGRAYAAELHLVHWNEELYSSFAEAAKAADGLAVLCVFIKVGTEHRFMSKLTSLMRFVTYSGQSVPIEGGFDPATLLPHDRSRYYTYSGSLTTPPCYESVRFLIFQEPIEFSPAQVNAFRQLKTVKRDEQYAKDDVFCGQMLCNCRPVQPLNDRVVLASFQC